MGAAYRMFRDVLIRFLWGSPVAGGTHVCTEALLRLSAGAALCLGDGDCRRAVVMTAVRTATLGRGRQAPMPWP